MKTAEFDNSPKRKSLTRHLTLDWNMGAKYIANVRRMHPTNFLESLKAAWEWGVQLGIGKSSCNSWTIRR
ncbi:MAG TPA: hypothetical protein QF478_05750 [Verrucomicrobiota bacterium]|jgi:hypothetical protein|nr:hypothetical protein [Verrucomicrobiota bacterium]